MSTARQKFDKASEEFNTIQQQVSQWVQTRQQLETQLQENKIVREEFDNLDDSNKIYKLVGPVLLPQDKFEAESNVSKRLEFIESEIKRIEANIKSEQEKSDNKRQELIQLRNELQPAE